MNKLIIIGILINMCLCGYSQDSIKIVQNNDLEFIGLRAIIYEVNDLQKAKEWYTNAFGLTPEIDESHYIGFDVNGYQLGLINKIEYENLMKPRVVCYWGVRNIQYAYDRLIKLGAMENEKPFNVGGEMMLATLKDPFGNLIGLEYNPYSQLAK